MNITLKHELHYITTPEEAADLAAAQGFEVIWPKKNQITLDFDNEDDDESFYKMKHLLDSVFGISDIKCWPSKSGKGQHFLIDLNTELTPAMRVAVQAACGSDPRRELLAIHLLLTGVDEPTVLFRPPTK